MIPRVKTWRVTFRKEGHVIAQTTVLAPTRFLAKLNLRDDPFFWQWLRQGDQVTIACERRAKP